MSYAMEKLTAISYDWGGWGGGGGGDGGKGAVTVHGVRAFIHT